MLRRPRAAAGKRDQSMVGDGHAIRVTRQQLGDVQRQFHAVRLAKVNVAQQYVRVVRLRRLQRGGCADLARRDEGVGVIKARARTCARSSGCQREGAKDGREEIPVWRAREKKTPCRSALRGVVSSTDVTSGVVSSKTTTACPNEGRFILIAANCLEDHTEHARLHGNESSGPLLRGSDAAG